VSGAPLTVFVTADPELPVPPVHYGGIERVVAQLVDGLAGRGHEVVLFAHAESRTAGELIPYPARHSRGLGATAAHAAVLAREYVRRRPAVIHSFGRLAYLAPLLAAPVPKVMSYQRVVTRSRVVWAHRAARGTLVFTGCSRYLIGPVADVGEWRVLYNSVPIERFTFSSAVAADAPLVFLGRMEEIKGPHLAIEAARRAGRFLILAGNIEPAHRTYFDRAIAPCIDGTAVQYVGPVDDATKNALLCRAAALLMPVLWDEPFGIVMAEALACGTPVLGLRRGAVPEVVIDGRTGFVCDTVDDLVGALARLDGIARRECRLDAERRFSSTAFVDACLSLYADLRGRGQAALAAGAAAGPLTSA
jgi:glycosyltransferase involved in cell wall biosynthesis